VAHRLERVLAGIAIVLRRLQTPVRGSRTRAPGHAAIPDARCSPRRSPQRLRRPRRLAQREVQCPLEPGQRVTWKNRKRGPSFAQCACTGRQTDSSFVLLSMTTLRNSGSRGVRARPASRATCRTVRCTPARGSTPSAARPPHVQRRNTGDARSPSLPRPIHGPRPAAPRSRLHADSSTALTITLVTVRYCCDMSYRIHHTSVAVA